MKVGYAFGGDVAIPYHVTGDDPDPVLPAIRVHGGPGAWNLYSSG